jgi:arsenate reductase
VLQFAALSGDHSRGRVQPHHHRIPEHPRTAAELERLVVKIGVSIRDLIRTKEPVYAELGLANAGDGQLLKAVAAHPILLNRPIVVTEKGAKLCRPPDVVREIL